MATTSNAGYYISKSGVEIQAVFNNTKFGDLHMIKYATQRDTANVHVMGVVDAVAIAKGKRATTGACVFAVFEKDRLIDAVAADTQIFLSNTEYLNYGNLNKSATVSNPAGKDGGLQRTDGAIVGSVFDAANYGTFTAPALADQIPPFDIVLVGISESSGNASRMIINGVQFNSDQGGSSIDDLTLERQLTFIAQRVTPWQDLATLANGSQAGTGWSNSF